VQGVKPRQPAVTRRFLPLALLLPAAADPIPPIVSAERIKADVSTLGADDVRGREPTAGRGDHADVPAAGEARRSAYNARCYVVRAGT
jgi:hypothetical protein